ncbi:sulfite exporter TauE/SafE family protein 3-like [Hibiscus syriacus]|uniref:sulfite exporter TauE/SafE family protein 3-like n=1 Tax=Hibiscus syriacus TaxID=106335 RepID=UPI001923578D|nr:sulfite exporter TauE/SafE family protein 3-like [Hibiscus syriacus]
MLAAQSAVWRLKFTAIMLFGFVVAVSVLVTAEPSSSHQDSSSSENNYVQKEFKYLELSNGKRYEHQWPRMRFGWKVVVGSILGFLGVAFGSVGGVGGGGIFVPMLALIIRFDAKSSTAISKCKNLSISPINGPVFSNSNNIRQRHPTLELPLIDYDLALLFKQNKVVKPKVSLIENICWKELGLLSVVWILVLALQIAKNYSTCSVEYWVLNFLQIPVTVGVSLYEAVLLYKGRREIASKGDVVANWRVHKLVIYCGFGVLAGILGGVLGLGGGFILGPLFLKMGIPPTGYFNPFSKASLLFIVLA